MSSHGDVGELPSDIGSGTCDWGDCDAVATKLRFDAWGHGWLPVCDACAVKPLAYPTWHGPLIIEGQVYHPGMIELLVALPDDEDDA